MLFIRHSAVFGHVVLINMLVVSNFIIVLTYSISTGIIIETPE